MKKILYIIFFCLNFSATYAIESKIIYVIQDEIITNIDIKNEFKYLLALNNKLESLDKEKIFKISKESIIREKIKKIELAKNFSDLEIDKRYTDKLLKNIYMSLNFKSLEEFNEYLKPYNQNVNDITKKLTIDALWNELIIQKYNSKIKINENELRKKILNKSKNETIQYNLSEIVYEVKDKKNIEKKYSEIVVINDGSSEQIIDNYQYTENINSIEIINMKENKGHARCIASGLKYIYKKKEFDFVIPMDGDGEDRPEEIKKFIQLAEQLRDKSIIGERIKDLKIYFSKFVINFTNF